MRILVVGGGIARGLVPATAVGVSVQRMVMRAAMRDTFAGTVRRQFGADTILAATRPRALT